MSSPTHVSVARPVNCDACKGTGRQALGFAIAEDGHPICEVCGGATMKQEMMPIEEFAKLFSWSKEFILNENSGSIIGERHVITVVKNRT